MDSSEVLRVDEALYLQLQHLWIERTPPSAGGDEAISAVIHRLRENFHLKQRIDEERILLYGRSNDKAAYREFLIGELVAIAPGIIVLDTTYTTRILSGLLERGKENETRLFSLRPFAPQFLPVSLCIRPSSFEKCFEQHCPVLVSWNVGAGKEESYLNLGIDSDRWKMMKPWLDKWLPQS
ncbi:MAG TPA: hypothetical protein VFQ60_01280 [Patescibacteria group bacterium]|nr:hypothetical protein [Patescibacteria group bacterium]